MPPGGHRSCPSVVNQRTGYGVTSARKNRDKIMKLPPAGAGTDADRYKQAVPGPGSRGVRGPGSRSTASERQTDLLASRLGRTGTPHESRPSCGWEERHGEEEKVAENRIVFLPGKESSLWPLSRRQRYCSPANPRCNTLSAPLSEAPEWKCRWAGAEVKLERQGDNGSQGLLTGSGSCLLAPVPLLPGGSRFWLGQPTAEDGPAQGDPCSPGENLELREHFSNGFVE